MTNFSAVKRLLEERGEKFKSETDTEVIAKLARYLYHQQIDTNRKPTFAEIVMEVAQMTEGAFALVFKSVHYPGQLIAMKRGSPLVMGVRRPNADGETYGDEDMTVGTTQPLASNPSADVGCSPRNTVEIFFASDTSPIVEHTKQVVYLEDEDVAIVRDGKVHIVNRLRSKDFKKLCGEVRTLHQLEMELESMAKGTYAHFMLKEIFEQPETILNSMRGRVNFEKNAVTLGGFKTNIEYILRARR